MDILEKAKCARRAFKFISQADTSVRNQFLINLAKTIEDSSAAILAANLVDFQAARQSNLPEAMLDRLVLDEKRLDAIVRDVLGLVDLPDPVGEVFDSQVLPNGLNVCKVRVPLGVLAVIYESRPNVTIDTACLAIKSGNCLVLRGGSETIESNKAFVQTIHAALHQSGLPEDAVQFIDDPERSLVFQLLQLDEYIDMIIPRGGAALHEFCRKNSRIPVITGGIGICHLFVDESADLRKAVEVIYNAKVQRPTVCNALDTVLLHRSIAARILPDIICELSRSSVAFRVDEEAFNVLGNKTGLDIRLAGGNDFDTEWLSLVIGITVVSSLQEAIDHIALHSTGHSDGILTENKENARIFSRKVDSAAVYVNASTRFTDGTQLGLGAEVAISTQRLHARGPMGLRELTTYKWLIEGDYQVRP
jgi:glutamate-5-semialdehyde dehydrogenase